MSVARFIADQRTLYRVPHAFSCRVLSVSEAWFYKWVKAPTTVRGARRALLDEAVREAFRKSGASYGSPRIHEDLIDPELPHPELVELAADAPAEVVPLRAQPAAEEPASDVTNADQGKAAAASGVSGADADSLLDRLSGPERLARGLPWRVSVNTVADSMQRQGLAGRKVKRNKGLTRQDKTAPKFGDLLKRDFIAATINTRWVRERDGTLRRLRRSSTGRESPPVLLTRLPARRLPAPTPTREAGGAAAGPTLTPRRHRLRLRELREPLPGRAVVPRLQPALPAPGCRRDLPELRGSRPQRGAHRRPGRRHAQQELVPGRQTIHHEEVSTVPGDAQVDGSRGVGRALDLAR